MLFKRTLNVEVLVYYVTLQFSFVAAHSIPECVADVDDINVL